jgi:hypothetical protein
MLHASASMLLKITARDHPTTIRTQENNSLIDIIDLVT